MLRNGKQKELTPEFRQLVDHVKAKILNGNEDFSEFFDPFADIAYQELVNEGQLPSRRAARLVKG